MDGGQVHFKTCHLNFRRFETYFSKALGCTFPCFPFQLDTWPTYLFCNLCQIFRFPLNTL